MCISLFLDFVMVPVSLSKNINKCKSSFYPWNFYFTHFAGNKLIHYSHYNTFRLQNRALNLSSSTSVSEQCLLYNYLFKMHIWFGINLISNTYYIRILNTFWISKFWFSKLLFYKIFHRTKWLYHIFMIKDTESKQFQLYKFEFFSVFYERGAAPPWDVFDLF